MSDQKHTYFNATILCQKTDPNSNDYLAQFEDTTAQNIVSRIGDYEFAIARYSMEGANIPIFIPSISNGNITTYTIQIAIDIAGINYGSGELSLIYTSPNSTVSSSDPSYYYIYNYDSFVSMVNAGFQQALANLKTNNPSVSFQTTAPILTYDGASNLFSIFCDAKSCISNTAGEQMTITFNNDLYTLLKTFNFQTIANNYRQLIVSNKITNTASQNGIDYWVATQTAPSTSNCWTPVQSIIFTSDSVSLKPEIIGNVSVVGNGLTLGANNSNNNQTMITDIVLDLTRSSDYFSEMISYVPSMYRWIDLSDGSNLRTFKFSVFWLNKFTQERMPVLLSNNGCITLKVLFQKKQ